MNANSIWLPRPVAMSWMTGLLCCLLTSNQHAQIFVGGTTTSGASGTTASSAAIGQGNAKVGLPQLQRPGEYEQRQKHGREVRGEGP